MEDFILIESQLSDEERLLQSTVRRFVNEQALPLIPEAYEQGYFPKQLIAPIAELGLLGMTLPDSVRGANASYVNYGLACWELEAGDSALRSFVSVQSSLIMYPIYQFGTPEQQQRWLPNLASGAIIGCFGLTEAQSGSDPASMKTQAKKVKGGWQLNGSKLWITNASFADIAIVWAKTDDGIRGFVVPKETPGFFRGEIKHKLSLRASATGELVFNDCFVADDCYLPGTEEGLTAALKCLNQARYGVAWGAMGAAYACYDIALSYCQQRKQFGKPIASFQLVQKDLVDMLNEIVKAQCLQLHVGRLLDNQQASPEMISLLKMNGCREALKIAKMARNLLGANGITLDYHVMRHEANLESVYTYEGTDNVHHLIIGREITGFNAFT